MTGTFLFLDTLEVGLFFTVIVRIEFLEFADFVLIIRRLGHGNS